MHAQGLRRLVLMAMLAALGVAFASVFHLPLLGSKVFPGQALINVIAAALLGPWEAAGIALVVAVLRIALGTGTPLAIPGGLFGALLAGYLVRWTGRWWTALVGELVGTGLIAALVSYPIALYVLGNQKVAAFTYIVPFTLASGAGVVLAAIVVPVLRKAVPEMRDRAPGRQA